GLHPWTGLPPGLVRAVGPALGTPDSAFGSDAALDTTGVARGRASSRDRDRLPGVCAGSRYDWIAQKIGAQVGGADGAAAREDRPFSESLQARTAARPDR